MLINKKDIIRINQEVGESGHLSNSGSLEFALNAIKHRKSWLYEVSYLVRSIIVDHVFKDGNKRTALAIIIAYFEDKKIEYDNERILDIIEKIAKKNINNVNKVMRLIKNAIIF